MALSKKQKADRAAKNLDAARLALAQAESAAVEAGVSVPQIEAPAIGGSRHRHTSTVWIGLKLPRGLVLRMSKKITQERQMKDGSFKQVDIFVADPSRPQVRLKGYTVPFGKVPNYTIIGDFGLTEVDRAWWDEWKSQNSGYELLATKTIFEHGEKASVEAYADEHADLKCGLEPMDPAGDARAEEIKSDNLSEIEQDTDREKQRKSPRAA